MVLGIIWKIDGECESVGSGCEILKMIYILISKISEIILIVLCR